MPSQQDDLQNRQAGADLPMLRHVAKHARIDPTTVEGNLPEMGHKACDSAEQAGLSTSVRPHQANDLCRRKLSCDILQNNTITKLDADPVKDKTFTHLAPP